MKGIVFTEFLEMVEGQFGYEMVDRIIAESDLSSDGVYTTIGTYNHTEIVALISNLSKHSEIEITALIHAFGRYFFDVLLNSYPQFFDKVKSSFEFLNSIENHIHVEVRKLYPDAELPSFDSEQKNDFEMTMIYLSERKLSDFALGLMERTIEHYGEQASITKENLSADGSKVKFTITKN